MRQPCHVCWLLAKVVEALEPAAAGTASGDCWRWHGVDDVCHINIRNAGLEEHDIVSTTVTVLVPMNAAQD